MKEPAFRRLDPGTLLLAAAAASVCFSLMRSLAGAGLCLLFSLVLAAMSRPELKRLWTVNLFILFLWLTVPATTPGETLASFGPFSWSREGVRLAVMVTIKCNAIVLAFLALAGGLELPAIGGALGRLGVPKKLVFLFLFTCRHIHVIGDEWRRLWTAAALRGFVPRTSMHSYRTLGGMLGTTLVNSVDRSRRVHEAMLLRGFDGTFRTVTDARPGRADRIFGAAFVAALAGLFVFDFFAK